ncbi:hypothetical protein [Pandoraea pnomenusa]|uniref:hypothetical protein n=1 Tax=Pandoraea pnomenusa TaxID=93220 RepID=UPI001ACBBA5E|nr:hypothetical protein [Pandoraea pnomenusa]MBN9093933.1 hypothetical protein [Pandoraea pnomenusa]
MTAQRVSKSELLKALSRAEEVVGDSNVLFAPSQKLCFISGWFEANHPDLAKALRRAAGQEAR